MKWSVPASLRLSSLSLLSGLVPYSNTWRSVWTDCSSSRVALRPRILCKNTFIYYIYTALFCRTRNADLYYSSTSGIMNKWKSVSAATPDRPQSMSVYWPRTVPSGLAPAVGTRCSVSSQHALDDCCYLHRCTGVWAFENHRRGLHKHTQTKKKIYNSVLHMTGSKLVAGWTAAFHHHHDGTSINGACSSLSFSNMTQI